MTQIMNKIGFINNKLKYFKIQATSIGKMRWPRLDKEPIFNEWTEYINTYKETAPFTLKSVGMSAKQTWPWIDSEQEFVYSAFQGITISLIFAFVILLIASQNFVLSFFSIVSVAIVIASVLCLIVKRGWEFGVSESLCTVIIIGLSVDYCIHLATEY